MMKRRTLFQSLVALLFPWSEAASSVVVSEGAIVIYPAPDWAFLGELDACMENVFHAQTTLPEDGDPACARSVDEALRELMENAVCFRESNG